jgi:hypothetical protein
MSDFFSGGEIPSTGSFEEFCATAGSADVADLRFVHGQESVSRAPAKGLVRGVTWFGPGRSHSLKAFATAEARMTAVESVSLRSAAYAPMYATVFVAGLGVYKPSAAEFSLHKDSKDALIKADPSYTHDASGALALRSFEQLENLDVIGIPVCGAGFPNYGHFLFDGLPLVIIMAEQLRGLNARLIGGPLGEWQQAILTTLGLADRYVPMQGPRRFRRIVTSNLLWGHVPYPTRFARLAFDHIRLHLGVAPEPRNKRIFVIRPDKPGRRYLTNRVEVQACLEALGFETVQPELLKFQEQVRVFASARVVVGESGAAMANIGFCDPGTRVLEIMPDIYCDIWVRGACLVLSHEWHVYFAEAEAPIPDGAPGADRLDFRYRIDIPSLKEAVDQICHGIGAPSHPATGSGVIRPSPALPVRIAPVQGDASDAAAPSLEDRGPDASHLLVHLQDAGDMTVPFSQWAGMRGRGKRIEGFAVTAQDGHSPMPLTYQAILHDGTLSAWSRSGEFCGTRGQGRALHGFCFRLEEEMPRWSVSYEATFVDGSEIGPLPVGEICRAPSGAPLEAMRLMLVPETGTGRPAREPVSRTPVFVVPMGTSPLSDHRAVESHEAKYQ